MQNPEPAFKRCWPPLPAIAFVLSIVVFHAAPAAAQPVLCDGQHGAAVRLQPNELQRRQKQLNKAMAQRGVYFIDLPEKALASRAALERSLLEKDHCNALAALKALQAMVNDTRLARPFVTAKFQRISSMVERADSTAPLSDPAKRQRLQTLLAKAAQQSSQGAPPAANKTLNQILVLRFGLRHPWQVPEATPALAMESNGTDASAQAEQFEVTDDTVLAACPELAKRRTADLQTMEQALQALGQAMDDRSIRPLDFGRQSLLFDQLLAYRRAGAYWPATRFACALTTRVQAFAIDLGATAGRNHLVGKWRHERPLTKKAEPRFRELVRQASEQIMERQFAAAHLTLDQLLVILGEPSPPSQMFAP